MTLTPQPVPTQATALREEPIQSYARLAGILGILTLVAGGFGEAYVPSAIIVSGDAGATARNILASESLFPTQCA